MDSNSARKLVEERLGKYGRMDQVNLHTLSADVQDVLQTLIYQHNFYVHADDDPTTYFVGLHVVTDSSGKDSVRYLWQYGAGHYSKLKRKVKMYQENGFDYIGGKL